MPLKVRIDIFSEDTIYKRKHQASLNKQLKALGVFKERSQLESQIRTTDTTLPGITSLRDWLWDANHVSSLGSPRNTDLGHHRVSAALFTHQSTTGAWWGRGSWGWWGCREGTWGISPFTSHHWPLLYLQNLKGSKGIHWCFLSNKNKPF